MKKNVFALSVAAALAVLAGSASAQSIPTADATQFVVNAGGIGHIQLIPYYTVQNANNTLLNIVNTDQENGKAVKVRFRGARNSDDVFDFYLLLSPGDVWRSRVYRDENGNTRLDLNGDTTCTYPANAVVQGSAFPTSRVFNNDVAETREGYIELLTAADIPPRLTAMTGTPAVPAVPAVPGEGDEPGTPAVPAVPAVPDVVAGVNPLYTQIKHDNGVAPCGETVIDSAFYEALINEEDAAGKGFYAPTTGLIANWAVMNVETGSTASGNGTALQAIGGELNTGNIVIAPQRETEVPASWVDVATGATTDPLFTYNTQAEGAAPILAAAYYDFPDLSTPYLTEATDAADQANLVSNALAVSQVINEFTTGEAGFKTDWVFSLPTRRYGVAIDYADETATAIEFNPRSAFFTRSNATLNRTSGVPSVQITLSGTYWDKEEGQSNVRQGAVISPSTPAGLPYISGEVNVFTFNGNAPESILGGTIAYNNIAPQVAGAAVESGWANFSLTRPANGQLDGLEGTTVVNGLPVIGYATMTAGNGINLTYPHRFSQAADTRD